MFWVVHPIAAVLLAMYAGIVWRKGSDGNRHALGMTAVLLVLAVLGAGWVVHPAAAISLAACFAFAGGNLFKRHSNEGLRVLASTALFGVFGAGWVFIPLVVATAISLMSNKHSHPRGRQRQVHAKRVRANVAAWPPNGPWPAVSLDKQPVATPAPAPANLTVLAQDSRLPSDAAKRAKALNLQCFETLAYIKDRGPGGARLQFEVEQIHQDFAVEAINAYLALAPGSANTVVLRDGKTGLDLLNEQLDLLSEGVHDAQQRAEELGAEQILASHTFVQQKFAQNKTTELKL